MGGMSADMMASMPADAMANMSPDMMASMPADAMAGMSADMMAAMPADAMANMSPDMMASMPADAMGATYLLSFACSSAAFLFVSTLQQDARTRSHSRRPVRQPGRRQVLGSYL
jgi:hypothetical protein